MHHLVEHGAVLERADNNGTRAAEQTSGCQNPALVASLLKKGSKMGILHYAHYYVFFISLYTRLFSPILLLTQSFDTERLYRIIWWYVEILDTVSLHSNTSNFIAASPVLISLLSLPRVLFLIDSKATEQLHTIDQVHDLWESEHRRDKREKEKIDKSFQHSFRSCYMGYGFLQTRHSPHPAAETNGGGQHALQGRV